MLAKAGADFNHVYNDYKEKAKPLAVREESKDEIDTDDETEYLSTILLNQIKHSDEFIKRQAADFDMPANNFGMRRMPFGANPVIAPAEKLPSASLWINVFGVFVTDSRGLSYFKEFQEVTPSPILIRPVSISIPSSPMANVGFTLDHS